MACSAHFFHSSTSKSASTLKCFVHWLRSVLRATTACAFLTSSKGAPMLVCFVHFYFEMCFAPERRAIVHLSSGQMAPHPPLERAHFSTLWSHKSSEKDSEPRLFYTFLPFRAPASFFFVFFFSDLLSFPSSLTLPTSAFLSSVYIVGSLTSKLPSVISHFNNIISIHNCINIYIHNHTYIYLIACSKPAGHREVASRERAAHPRWKPEREAKEKRRRRGEEDKAAKPKQLV